MNIYYFFINILNFIFMDFILAHSKFQRKRYTECIKICDQLLTKNARDQEAWMLKCSSLIKQNQIDQLEIEEEAVADILMEDKQQNKLARIGTSFQSNNTSNPILRPMSKSGRVSSGYMRPGTSRQNSRAASKGGKNGQNLLNSRAGVPVTSNGRALRLGTASISQNGQTFFESDKVNMKNMAKKKRISRLIWKYLFYVQHNLKKAHQLAAEATIIADYKDPWWKLALGKCYYHLGFYKDAEKQLLSSVKHNNNIDSYIYLSKIYEKQDQVQKSISILQQGLTTHPKQIVLFIHIGRIYQQINNLDKSMSCYKDVLELENCNVEAVANIAAYYFYQDQPEVASKLYQRLIQLGMNTPEVWNNLALCCFHNSKYELFYSCFERALELSVDQEENLSDIWYNIGDMYIGLGNLQMAERCFKISLGYYGQHAQSLNNLGVLQWKKNNMELAISLVERSFKESGAFDSAFNLSIWYYKQNNLKNAKQYNQQSLKLYPQHTESLLLQNKIHRLINI